MRPRRSRLMTRLREMLFGNWRLRATVRRRLAEYAGTRSPNFPATWLRSSAVLIVKPKDRSCE